MINKKEVEAFLREMRDKISVFDIAFRPRDKNTDTLAELDIIPNDRINFLKKLSFENYYTGPNEDTHDPNKPNYYEFGILIKGVEVYIKISLGLESKRVDCMSFHIAKRRISYPLKNEES